MGSVYVSLRRRQGARKLGIPQGLVCPLLPSTSPGLAGLWKAAAICCRAILILLPWSRDQGCDAAFLTLLSSAVSVFRAEDRGPVSPVVTSDSIFHNL